MAIVKEVMTDVGIPANFWLVSKVDIDKVAEQGLITLYGYVNKEHSDADSGYLERRFINIYPADFYNVFSLEDLNLHNPYALAYEFTKTTEEFQDAEDAIYNESGELISS